MMFGWGWLSQFGLALLLQGQVSLAGIVDEPKNCWQENIKGCAAKTLEKKFTFSRQGWEVTASPRATFQWDHAGVLKFLAGDFLLRAQVPVVIDLMGEKVEVQGEFLISRLSLEKMILRNVSGQAQFSGSAFLKSESLPMGFENWYGKSTGASLSRGVITPWNVEEALPAWVSLMDGSREAREGRIKEFQKIWKKAVLEAGDFYQEVSRRRIASELSQKQAAQKKREQRLKEQEEILQLYRARVLDGEYGQ